MEASETPATSDVDLSNGGGDDPFAHVPPDPLADPDLPPGVQPGSLPGDNPSELEPLAEEGDEPLVEPTPEEILEEPEERDASPDEEDYPQGEGPVVPDEQPEPETPVAGSDPKEKAAVAPEPEEPKAPKRQRKAKKPKEKKATASSRGYVILREGSEPGVWQEAFERPDPQEEEPFVLDHRNGTTALRAAYRMLSEAEEKPQEYVLVCVPRKLWNVKKVRGRVHKQTAIQVG